MQDDGFWPTQPFGIIYIYIYYNIVLLLCSVCGDGASVQRQQLLLYIIHAGWTHCAARAAGEPASSVGRSVGRLGTPGQLSPDGYDGYDCDDDDNVTATRVTLRHRRTPPKTERGPW